MRGRGLSPVPAMLREPGEPLRQEQVQEQRQGLPAEQVLPPVREPVQGPLRSGTHRSYGRTLLSLLRVFHILNKTA